jgi:dihydroorotate dehydrogenase electron transfer subunit
LPPSRLQQAEVIAHRSAGEEYFRLVLRAPSFTAAVPGQFVMLRVSENRDPLLARPFGIASVIGRSSIELYYRVAGRGTSLLTAVRPGQRLTVLGPLGNGFPAPARNAIPLLVAGGSGFPPLLYFAARYGKRARIFVGSRNKACLPPASAMKDFRSRVDSIHYATEDGSRGTCGFVTDTLAAFLDSAGRSEPSVIYACGPPLMLAAVSRLAAERRIPCYVSMEERMACGLGVCMGCSVPVASGGYKRVCKEGPVFDSSEISWSGVEPVHRVKAERGARNEE